MFSGIFLIALCWVGMVVFEDFVFFAILFVVRGIGMAFISGSGSAFLYDSLKSAGQEKKYLGINARVNTLSSVVFGLATLAGGYMQIYSWSLVYLSYAGAMIVALIIVGFMHEPNIATPSKADSEEEDPENHQDDGLKKIFMKYFKSSQGKSLLLFILAYAIYQSVAPYFAFGQTLFDSYHMSPTHIALIYSIVQFFKGVGYLMSEKISKKFSLMKLIYSITSLTTVLLLFHLIESKIGAVVLFFVISFTPEILYIVTDHYIQENIPSRIRASLLSLSSCMNAIFISLVYVIFGFLIDTFTIRISLVMLAVLPFISLILFVLYFTKYQPEKKEQSL